MQRQRGSPAGSIILAVARRKRRGAAPARQAALLGGYRRGEGCARAALDGGRQCKRSGSIGQQLKLHAARNGDEGEPRGQACRGWEVGWGGWVGRRRGCRPDTSLHSAPGHAAAGQPRPEGASFCVEPPSANGCTYTASDPGFSHCSRQLMPAVWACHRGVVAPRGRCRQPCKANGGRKGGCPAIPEAHRGGCRSPRRCRGPQTTARRQQTCDSPAGAC